MSFASKGAEPIMRRGACTTVTSRRRSTALANTTAGYGSTAAATTQIHARAVHDVVIAKMPAKAKQTVRMLIEMR